MAWDGFYRRTGKLFWVISILFGSLYAYDQTDYGCDKELIDSITTADGLYRADLRIISCGGATTDFRGHVFIVDLKHDETSASVFDFLGKPSNTGITIKWKEDNVLLISMDSLKKVQRLSHGVEFREKKPGDFGIKVLYEVKDSSQSG